MCYFVKRVKKLQSFLLQYVTVSGAHAQYLFNVGNIINRTVR